MTATAVYGRAESRNLSICSFFPMKVVGGLALKVIFHQRLSSIKGSLPLKDVFQRRSSFIKCRLSLKVVFHQSSSSIKGCLPSQFVFNINSLNGESSNYNLGRLDKNELPWTSPGTHSSIHPSIYASRQIQKSVPDLKSMGYLIKF